jgi:serine acetyltransferase
MIGDDITVGAGSVVTRNIQNSSIAVRSPARMIKKVEADANMARKRYRVNTSCAWKILVPCSCGNRGVWTIIHP